MLRLEFCLSPISYIHPPLPSSRAPKSLPCLAAASRNSDLNPDAIPAPKPKPKPKPKHRRRKIETAANEPSLPPTKLPRKPRRGRRSEAAAVADYITDTLSKTFATIKEQNPDIEFETKSPPAVDDEDEEEDDDEVIEEESKDWPLDAEVGWGIRASEYFENHGIRNVVDENGVEIDWEGEIEDNWVKEINCLEWESFAFHPSPLVVFVFERYNRAAQNWKALKELEKAVKVYWDAKDRLPPRSVKIDMNIERDLAYALKVRDCPQILFLRGNRILYREKEIRTSEELVAMIAHFYYNAKRPSWVDVKELSRPF